MNVVLDQEVVDKIKSEMGYRSFSSLIRELLLKYLKESKKTKQL